MNKESNATVVDNAKDGGLEKALVIKIKDPTTKDTSILDVIAEDIGFRTADATAEYTVVYAKNAGVDVQKKGAGVERTGVVIKTL